MDNLRRTQTFGPSSNFFWLNNKWISVAFSEYLNFNGNLFQERSLKNKHYYTHANKVHIFWEGYKNWKKKYLNLICCCSQLSFKRFNFFVALWEYMNFIILSWKTTSFKYKQSLFFWVKYVLLCPDLWAEWSGNHYNVKISGIEIQNQ